jgi:hypothetical protein
MNMFTLIQLVACLALMQGAHAFQCYWSSVDQYGGMVVQSYDTTRAPLICNDTTRCVCTSYQAPCSTNNTACTDSEIQAKTTKWFYKLTSQDTCTMMAQTPSAYMSVTCCNTSYCNNQSMIPLLKCYVTVTDSNNATIIQTMDSAMVGLACNVSGGCVCASYRRECASDVLQCTEIEAKAKTVKWLYELVSKTWCTMITNSPSGIYKEVQCCDTDLCNTQRMGNTAATAMHSSSAWITLLILYITFKCISFF